MDAEAGMPVWVHRPPKYALPDGWATMSAEEAYHALIGTTGEAKRWRHVVKIDAHPGVYTPLIIVGLVEKHFYQVGGGGAKWVEFPALVARYASEESFYREPMCLQPYEIHAAYPCSTADQCLTSKVTQYRLFAQQLLAKWTAKNAVEATTSSEPVAVGEVGFTF